MWKGSKKKGKRKPANSADGDKAVQEDTTARYDPDRSPRGGSFVRARPGPEVFRMLRIANAVPDGTGAFFAMGPVGAEADALQAELSVVPTEKEADGKNCAHCHADPGDNSGGRCKGCAQKDKPYVGPVYCSRACQSADWSAHKAACRGRKNRRGIEITDIKFDVVGSEGGKGGGERAFAHQVKDPKTGDWTPLTESVLDQFVYAGGNGPMGSTPGASAAVRFFTLLMVVELPIAANQHIDLPKKCPPIGAAKLTACFGFCDYMYGSACGEQWESTDGGRMRVRDVVAIVMERFRVRYTIRECQKLKLNKGTTWGATERLGVMGESAKTGTFVKLASHFACGSEFRGPAYMLVGGSGDGDADSCSIV